MKLKRVLAILNRIFAIDTRSGEVLRVIPMPDGGFGNDIAIVRFVASNAKVFVRFFPDFSLQAFHEF